MTHIPTSGHTATPWKHYDDTGPSGKTGRHEIVALGKTVARIYRTNGDEIEDAANAAFIVKAVNSHDMLVEALEAALASAALPTGAGIDEGGLELRFSWVDRARAALKAVPS